ncbi:hypothetical protein TSUD_108750 [Trifolium subterraneum]|nr:hypothetical protein TSUD_108750 [Trifolium subterraneum]
MLIVCHGLSMTMGMCGPEDKEDDHPMPRKLFMMTKSKRMVNTDAGEMRVLESYGKIHERRLHIGVIDMEPNSLFVPQYLDSTLILFIRSGEAKVGFIYEGDLAEKELKKGDVYLIPAGSAFYLLNTGKDQKLEIICSIDPSESLGLGVYQSFYIGGGANPVSVLSGFQPQILESAFNVSAAELTKFFTRQHEGPIVYVGESHAKASSLWTKFLQLKEDDKLQHMMEMMQDQEEDEDDNDEVEQNASWSWRKLLESVFGFEIKNNKKGTMMTPHVNPSATEYAIVVRGVGRLQVAFPNGTLAMDTHIKEGDVFFIPRYFAFSQIAANVSDEPLDFFGFTTSAKKNKPQFLVGANSLMKSMMGPELAASFGVSEDTMKNILNAQHESVILPSSVSH